MTKDIVMICDDNYCLPTAVCIQSLIENYSANEKITVHVCTFGLNDSNVKKLKSMGSHNLIVSIDLFSGEKYENRIREISQKSHVTPTALIKFELPNYFADLDTVLYMDSDIVVKSDITQLLFMSVNDNYLAASFEFFEHLKRIQYTLKRSIGDSFYFNSGVMLLNLKKMREDHISDSLWDYKLNKAKTKLMDQESLNAICSENAIHLPIKWNFNPIFCNIRYVKLINSVYGTDYCDVQSLQEDIRIIHYVGARDKPWVYKNARMRDFWERYFELTPFYCELDLKTWIAERRPFYKALASRVKDHGLWGTFCYMIYNVKNRR